METLKNMLVDYTRNVTHCLWGGGGGMEEAGGDILFPFLSFFSFCLYRRGSTGPCTCGGGVPGYPTQPFGVAVADNVLFSHTHYSGGCLNN